MKKLLVVGMAAAFATASFGQSIIKRGYTSLPPQVTLWQATGTNDPGVLDLPDDLTKWATEKYKTFYGMDEDSTVMKLDSRITVVQDVELVKWLCWSKKCVPGNAYQYVKPSPVENSPYVLNISKGPYDTGTGFWCVVQYIQRGTYNIRRHWGLLFSPPGTTFRLYITYSRVGGTFIADGSTIPTRTYQNFSEWRVKVDQGHFNALINLFEDVPAGVSEVPKISPAMADDLHNLVNYIHDYATTPEGMAPLLKVDLNNDGVIDPNTPEQVRSAADAVFVFIDLLGRYCTALDKDLGNQFAVPDVAGFVTGSPDMILGFNYQSAPQYYKMVVDTREEPLCCKFISDVEWYAQTLGVPILAPNGSR